MDERAVQAMLLHADNKGLDFDVLRQETAMQLAKLVGCKPTEVFFTSGITPAIHLGMAAVFESARHRGNHIITSKSEYGETLKACEDLKMQGAEITYLNVDREGLTDPEELKAAITPATVMVSMIAANNQTGVIQPLEQIGDICRDNKICFFSDASQYVGKMRCDINEAGIEYMVFGSHKMYGPKGIGALIVKENADVYPAMLSIEKNELKNISAALLAGFAKAAEVFTDDHWEDSSRISKIKGYFEHQLLEIEGLRINGSTRYRLYNTSNLTFPPHKNINQLADRFKFTSFAGQSSHVLKAMGLSDEDIKNSYRFSFGRYNTLDEVKLLVDAIMAL